MGIFTSDDSTVKKLEIMMPNTAAKLRRKADEGISDPEVRKQYNAKTSDELYTAMMVEEYKKQEKLQTQWGGRYDYRVMDQKAGQELAQLNLAEQNAFISARNALMRQTEADIADAEQAAAVTLPVEAVSLQPTVAQSAKVYDMSSYAIRARALIEEEAKNNNSVRAQLESIRQNVSTRAQAEAQNRNMQYVQELKASLGDNTTINSTVPVAVEQTPETVQNDDRVAATEPMSIKEAYMALEQMELSPSESELAYAALEQGDPSVVEQYIHEQDALSQAEAQYLAELDATKQVAMELAKESGKEFAQGTVNDILAGKLSANKFLKNFDYFMGNLGDSIGSYVGAALSGIPSPNDCSSQTLTNFGLGVSGMLTTINTAATIANGLATFGANLADSLADIYAHGPELLISMAETTAQTAAQTTMMALRNASKTNCTAAFAYGTIKGAVAVGETTIKAGISVATKAKELKGAAEHLTKVVEKKDFMGDLKKRIQLHPAVREMNRFIDGDKFDLAAYSRLTRNGDKFARVMLGVDQQDRFTSVKKHAVQPTTARAGFRRNNYSTTQECNKWNCYAKQSFSLANAF